MAVHVDSSVMDRVNKIEERLMLHQNKVASRLKEDFENMLHVSNSHISLSIQKSNMDILKMIKVHRESTKVQLDKVEDRLINTKSVQIGLMEARMVLNTHEAMMQIGNSVNKLGKDILDTFVVLKGRLTMMQTTIEVGLEVGREVKEPKKRRVRSRKGSVTKQKKIGKGSTKSKSVPNKSTKDASHATSVSKSDEEEITFLDSLVKCSENTIEEKVAGFDSDFLDLMRDANIVPEELGSEVPEKKIKTENQDEVLTHEVSYCVSVGNKKVLEADIIETVAVKNEPTVDVKIEEGDSPTKVEKEVIYSTDIIYNNNTSDVAGLKVMHVPIKIIRIPPPKTVRILPPVCPQVRSKLCMKRRHHSSSFQGFSSTLPVFPFPVTNMMMPPHKNQNSLESSSSVSNMTQTNMITTPAEEKVTNIVFSCGFCGEDSFSKQALEDHIGVNHRNHFLE